MSDFDQRNREMIRRMGADAGLQTKACALFTAANAHEYSYHFRWLGRPIIQYPQDIVAIQELIWEVKPELIIETGIAHGGSLIFSASMLQLLGGDGLVVGVDIEIRPHNRQAIEAHPMAKRIKMIEASSIHEDTAAQIRALYAPLVTKGSYLVVLDTVIEDLPVDSFPNRPWTKTRNPKTAVREFLKTNVRFVVETEIENKLLLTVAPGGYLKCIAD
jgi:cephalosporin hydroxylase